MAEKNYYSTLNVPCSATSEEIKQAYRILAFKFHPDKNKEPEAEERFKEIVEAYAILNDDEKRNQYDRSREERIFYTSSKKKSEKYGGPDISFEGPRFNTTRPTFENPDTGKTFIDHFFEDILDDEDYLTEKINDLLSVHGSDRCNPRKTRPFSEEQFFNDVPNTPNKKFKRQDPAVEEDLLLSLEELFTGALKKLKISRKVYNQFGNYTIEEKIIEVSIMPGWKEGTNITFPNEGDRKPGVQPADVVFKLKDKTHRHFTRDSENNLIYWCKMSLRDALVGASVEIPTIDGKTLRINHDKIVQPGTQKLIKGEGLPRPKNPSTRADLIIKYDIFFPNYLSPHQRQVIIDSLPR